MIVESVEILSTTIPRTYDYWIVWRALRQFEPFYQLINQTKMIKNTTNAFIGGGYESPDAKSVTLNVSSFICQSAGLSINAFSYDEEDELTF